MAKSACNIICIVVLLFVANVVHTQASEVLESCAELAGKPKPAKYRDMLTSAKAIESDIIDIRRTLHRRPATRYEEYEAQALVIETLTELGLR